MRRHPVTLAALLAVAVLLPNSPASSQSACTFQLGFKLIRDQISVDVGACLEDEHFNVANGNAEQRTTAHHGKGGLLVWRKADNWTAFTDGHWTWMNGPNGLQKRLNADRFAFENDQPAPTGFDPRPYIGKGDRFNCGDFANQAPAQAVLRADPSDPNRLDAYRDGIACELNPGERDTVRVIR